LLLSDLFTENSIKKRKNIQLKKVNDIIKLITFFLLNKKLSYRRLTKNVGK